MSALTPDLLAQMEEAKAFLARMEKVKKEAEAERRRELAVLGSDFLAHVIETGLYKESETSAWAGYAENGIKLELNGREYSVSITITDVQRKSERVEGVDYTPRKKKAA